MPDAKTKHSQLSQRNRALINELGGDNKTVVSAQMVSALNGNGNAAIYLSQLLWWGKRKADEEGWFFRTRDQMQERCGLGKQAQRTAEKTLKALDLIDTDRRGMPAKKHYRIHYEEVISLFCGSEPDTGPTRQDKSQGVGGATSSGGYAQEQDAGGRCQNPIESNTESNKEQQRRPAGADGGGEITDSEELTVDLVMAWRDVRGAPPMTKGIEDALHRWAKSGTVTDPDLFAEVLRDSVDSTAGRDAGIDLKILREEYEEREGAQTSKYMPSDDPDLDL